jgi:putative PIN family toxin of toxin-antitoxin system
LDTNILISSLMRRHSPPDRARRAWERGRFILLTSDWQIEELRRVSRYPKLRERLKPAEVGALVSRMRRKAVVLLELPTVTLSSDPDDNPLLATALAGEADFLVTGDKSDLLGLGAVGRTRVVSAGVFVEGLG